MILPGVFVYLCAYQNFVNNIINVMKICEIIYKKIYDERSWFFIHVDLYVKYVQFNKNITDVKTMFMDKKKKN